MVARVHVRRATTRHGHMEYHVQGIGLLALLLAAFWLVINHLL